jgi:hypothetical protein
VGMVQSNQKYFHYKSSPEYLSAKEYVEIFEQNQEYCNVQNLCQVLVCLITTGEYNTAQDVSYNAKWREYTITLFQIAGADFGKYYQQIIDILIAKSLDKIVAHFALSFKDKQLISKYYDRLETWEDMIDAVEIIAADYPEIALTKISSISRVYISEYTSFYHQDDFRNIIPRETMLKILFTIKSHLTELSHKKIDALVKKIGVCYDAFKS